MTDEHASTDSAAFSAPVKTEEKTTGAEEAVVTTTEYRVVYKRQPVPSVRTFATTSTRHFAEADLQKLRRDLAHMGAEDAEAWIERRVVSAWTRT